MKRNTVVLITLFTGFITGILCFGMFFFAPENARAATKNKVSCSVKNGTLTFYGKGAISSSQTKIRQKDSIKKIVVKKGVTSVPQRAFCKFRNVKEVIIAGSVKKIGQEALPASKALKKVTIPGTFRYDAPKFLETDIGVDTLCSIVEWGGKSRIDTVCFNTPLSLKTLIYIKSNNLVVSKGDKKYKSIHGVIYSKDGKSIVRVPVYRESLAVEEGCEEFCFQSVMYANKDSDGEDEKLMCEDLKTITLPASVKTVSKSKYYSYQSCDSQAEEFIINTNRLDSKSILSLLESFPRLKEDQFLEQFDYVLVQDGMYINSRDACLLRYTGTADEVVVPDGVKKIGKDAFSRKEIKRAVLPDSVEEIGDEAFEGCIELKEVQLPASMTVMGKKVFGYCIRLNNITFPNGMATVPESTFEGCGGMKDITLPDTVTTIEKSAFEKTRVPASILLQGRIREIKEFAFFSCGWREIIFPDTIEKVDMSYMFSEDATLTFKGDVENWQTDARIHSKSGSPVLKIGLQWQKITGVDGWQIQVSPDKSFKKKETYYAKKEAVKMEVKSRKMKIKYVRIRPWKTVDGERNYGKWTITF